MAGTEGLDGPTFWVSSRLCWKRGHVRAERGAGSTRQGRQIVLNVTGQMEAQLAAGWGARGPEGASPWQIWAGWGRVRAWERPGPGVP